MLTGRQATGRRMSGGILATTSVLAILTVGTAGLQAAPLFTLQLQSTPKTSTENTGASASIGFDILSTAQGYVVDLTLTNTTPPAIGANLTAVGLEWPDIFSAPPTFAAHGTSSYFDTLGYNYMVSPGWLNAPGGYDVMITSDGNFQGGSPKGGPQANQSQTIRLALAGTSLSLQQLQDEFASFYAGGGSEPVAIARFQAVGPLADRSDMVITPEPATLLLFSLAAMGLVHGRTRSTVATR